MIVKFFHGGQMISYINNLQYVPSNGEDIWVNGRKYYVFDRSFEIVYFPLNRTNGASEANLVCNMELATQ
jgi:hypothetical protein